MSRLQRTHTRNYADLFQVCNSFKEFKIQTTHLKTNSVFY